MLLIKKIIAGATATAIDNESSEEESVSSISRDGSRPSSVSTSPPRLDLSNFIEKKVDLFPFTVKGLTDLSGEIYCPIDSELNEHTEAVHREILEWVVSTGLIIPGTPSYEKFEKSKFTFLCGYASKGQTHDQLLLMSKWVSLLFIYDDCIDDPNSPLFRNCKESDRLERVEDLNEWLKNILNLEEDLPMVSFPEEDGFPLSLIALKEELAPLGKALSDIQSHLKGKYACKMGEQFFEEVASYFQTTEWETENRAEHTVPEEAKYLTMRKTSGAVPTVFKLAEVFMQVMPPRDVRMNRISEATNNCICVTNDLFSLPSDIRDHTFENLILVKYHASIVENWRKDHPGEEVPRDLVDFSSLDKNLLQAAFDSTVKFQNSEMKEVYESVEKYKAAAAKKNRNGGGLDKSLESVLSIRLRWIRANLDWSKLTRRYS